MSGEISNTFEVNTRASLFNAKAGWSVELDDPLHMAKYQTYGNSLVALAMAKLGEFALEQLTDPDAVDKGYRAIAKAMQDVQVR